jgi:uroporphyrinogen-III synthase
VLSLRPSGGHAPLRRAAAAHGARLLALSPWRLQRLHDDATRAAVAAACAAPWLLATSPEAVAAAHALQPLPRGRRWLAIGSGTATRLRRLGIAEVTQPERMDSEGLLALPLLQDVRGRDIGLLTGRGGRDALAPALQARGARVRRADVYARIARPLPARALHALCALEAPAWLALSSGGALQQLLATLPGEARAPLLRARVVAASTRLAQLARASGFDEVIVAASARPRELMAAAARAALA